MRCQRVKMSISVWFSMCPMCSEPVTFGGGITIEKVVPGLLGSALNSSSLTQYSAQRGSICCGSYALAISRAIRSALLALARRHTCREDMRVVIFDYTGELRVASTQPEQLLEFCSLIFQENLRLLGVQFV